VVEIARESATESVIAIYRIATFSKPQSRVYVLNYRIAIL